MLGAAAITIDMTGPGKGADEEEGNVERQVQTKQLSTSRGYLNVISSGQYLAQGGQATWHIEMRSSTVFLRESV